MNLANRSVRSVAWATIANALYLGMSLVRSVLLARWLPIEIFGIYAAARAFVEITKVIPDLGMDGAFLHRAPEVEDEEKAAAMHFTLKVVLTTSWIVCLAAYLFLFPSQFDALALTIILGTVVTSHFTQTASLLLARRIVYRRLSLLQVTNGAITLIVGLVLGWSYNQTGRSDLALWALLSSHVITAVLNVFFLYLWKPVWRPRLTWDSHIVRYFIGFGGRNFVGILLLQIIDRIDDLWTKFYIGDVGLGLYSRAYTFATYPRELVARPVAQVSTGTYAALKHDRQRLSQAFFRTNAFLVRAGFLTGGVLFLIAPEFIHLVLTDKWMPMLNVFRLMLLFTLLDPLKTSVTQVMVSMGYAERSIPARVVQLLVLITGLYIFGSSGGIEGVAIAVNVMLLVGMVMLFWQAKEYVDFSIRKLFLVPLLSLAIAIAGGWVLSTVYLLDLLNWISLGTKTAVFMIIYFVLLFLLERNETLQLLAIRRYLLAEFRPFQR